MYIYIIMNKTKKIHRKSKSKSYIKSNKSNSKHVNNIKQNGGKKKKYNLVYMAKPSFGGWRTFTAHLSKKYDYDLYKIGNKTESKTRPYGYDVEYQNVSIDDLLKKPNLLITAIDKNYYEHLPKLNVFKVITIRETVHNLLKNKYKIKNTFLHHPFYEFKKPNNNINKNRALALSRVDFDKHTDIIIDANDKLPENKRVDIYGAQNDLYVYHKLRDTNYKKYYKGKFPKEFSSLVELLEPCKFLVDMSAIKGDGGGSQYTFLEAIYMDCALVLNSKWVKNNTDNIKTPFKHGVNCYIVNNKDELAKLLRSNLNTVKITNNAKKLLKPHLLNQW